MESKSIEEVKKCFIKSCDDRQLLEIILDQVGNMAMHLKLAARIEKALQKKAKKAKKALGWRPIETAPKDTKIVLFYNEGVGPIVGIVGVFVGYKCTPTHWMPIPEPPS